jgi:hypothetical protein
LGTVAINALNNLESVVAGGSFPMLEQLTREQWAVVLTCPYAEPRDHFLERCVDALATGRNDANSFTVYQTITAVLIAAVYAEGFDNPNHWDKEAPSCYERQLTQLEIDTGRWVIRARLDPTDACQAEDSTKRRPRPFSAHSCWMSSLNSGGSRW